ncbi:MAG: hypothetical protein WAK01_00410 [Methylocystis sp.]
MLYTHFQKNSRENGRLTADSSNESDGLAALAADEFDETSISRLQMLELDAPFAPSSGSFPSPLVKVSVLLLCVTLAAYFFLSGLYLLGAWAACAFFSWAFLLGAAVATNKSDCDRERSAVPETRSRARNPETKKGAPVGSRSRAESSPPAGDCASKRSPPLSFTVEMTLFGRPIDLAPRRFQNPH